MAGLNKAWEKYGCNDYDLVVVEANFVDSKSSFKSWCQKWNLKYAAVAKNDGGKTFDSALKNGGWGGPKYMIKPDKTFEKASNYNQLIQSLGIKPQECGQTSIVNTVNNPKPNITVYKLGNKLHIAVPQNGIYNISVYSAKGMHQVFTGKKQLHKGANSVNIFSESIVSGIYFIEISSDMNTSTTKMVYAK